MSKVYISVPITDLNYNDQRYHAFNAASTLGLKGYDVITPFDIIKDPSTPYNECMGKCIEQLLQCEAIYLCKGWRQSKGCNAELQVALIYGLEIMSE